ncbi:hypothetical protein SAMN05443667_102258 [Flavobacterium gillisiae]|uniref:Uncharacterized protein n=1 Tax=Flavobacterium gillisiae TaxID=150146 RepID=A0A1H3Z4W3_9FLAO|nr:hypothetical protein [Flavobacterium gillisiae]SEA18707.1 hypothetical protein SAMN05443667_102258 [Flavobacterium gillisiae]
METAKLKGQNVIKYVLLIVFLFTSNYMFCQKKITGIYSSLMPHQEHYNYFDFNTNGTFEYHSGASLGDDEFGKGYYQIKNDSLILNYDLTEIKEDSYYKSRRYYNSKDSIQIKFNAYNFNKTPIQNIQIYSYPNYKSTKTDSNGVATLSFKKVERNSKMEIHIDGAFLAKQVIYIDVNTNYIIDVYMSKSVIIGFGHPKAIKNETEKYKILEYQDDIIKLKNNSRVMDLIKQSK